MQKLSWLQVDVTLVLLHALSLQAVQGRERMGKGSESATGLCVPSIVPPS